MEATKIKSSSKYQKEIDKSFAVIYHNLKRIQENDPLEGKLRRHSQPDLPASYASLQRNLLKEKSHSLKEAPSKTMNRRVNFSVDS